MARANVSNRDYGRAAVVGNLAYDFDYLERERSAELETRRKDTAPAARTAPKSDKSVRSAKKLRVREKVSAVAVLGAVALSFAVMMVIMSYAELTTLSNSVVGKQKQLQSLQEQHVVLLTEYEQTFDLAAIKAAAEAAGMYKPSASQVYYIDLSAPDNVTLYETRDTVVLTRVFTSFGRGVASAVEYFS